MRRGLLALGGLVAFGACSLAPGSPSGSELPPEIRAVLESPRYASARWGLEVVDLETGQMVHDLRPTETFLTGSTAKIFSVTAALATLGPDYRFETPVFRYGLVDARGTLFGDLILQGVGDLTLGGRTKPDGTIDVPIFDHYDANVLPGLATLTPEDPLAGLDDLARQVRNAGIRRVAGDVVVDDRLWEPVVQDGVPISPIVVNDNLIDFLLTPGASTGMAATFDWRPRTAAYEPDVAVTTGAAGTAIQLDITEPVPGRLVVRGTIPAGLAPVVRTYQVPDPATFARALFLEALMRAGVVVGVPGGRMGSPADESITRRSVAGANPAERLPAPERLASLPKIAKFVSPPYSEHARLINKVSHNLGANLIPPLLAVRNGKRTHAEGMEIERALVRSAGVDPSLFTLVDGQGLSGNAVAPRAQTQYLRWLVHRPEFPTFFDSTPILGVDGSLANVIPEDDPARGHVHAKTGTLVTGRADGTLVLQTKALAGYIDSSKGRRLAFAIYLNDLPIAGIDDVLAANTTLGHLASLLYQAH